MTQNTFINRSIIESPQKVMIESDDYGITRIFIERAIEIPLSHSREIHPVQLIEINVRENYQSTEVGKDIDSVLNHQEPGPVGVEGV